MSRKFLLTAALIVAFTPALAQAGIMDTLDMNAGAQSIDTTATVYADWGYATGALLDESPAVWDNEKSGFTPDLVITQTGLAGGTRGYGHEFTFNDGTSPASGVSVATDGNTTNLNNNDGVTLTFEDIVDATEKVLTLYIGTFNSNASATLNFESTLTGGVLDESTGNTTFGFPSGTTPGIYEITFSSLTETDLVVDLSITNTGGATRNFGISGYTLTAPQVENAPVPEPASIAIWAMIGIGLCGYGWRRYRCGK